MFENLLNIDFHNCSDEELRDGLQQLFFITKKALEVVDERFCNTDIAASESSKLDTSNKNGQCDKLYEQYKAILPSVTKGTGREITINLDFDKFEKHNSQHSSIGQAGTSKSIQDKLKTINRIRYLDIFEEYVKIKAEFKTKQWEVIYLYYHDGLTQQQIGKRLDKSRTAISGLLCRAKDKKAAYNKKLRREMYEILRKK